MIILDIIQNDEQRAIDISSYLIKNNYALQTHIDSIKIFNSTSEIKTIRLFFTTKYLLFDVIDKVVKEKFYSDDLLTYATPVSHISKKVWRIIENEFKSCLITRYV